MALRPPRMAPGVARRMSERARAADHRGSSGEGDEPAVEAAGGFAGMVDALRSLVREFADAAQAAGAAGPSGAGATGDGTARLADGARAFSLGEGGSRMVFGYSLRLGPNGVSAEPFGHVPSRPPAGSAVSSRHAAPAARQPIVDIFEEAGVIVVVAELPGADPASIMCRPQGSRLLIEASGGQRYAKAIELPGTAMAAGMVQSFRHGILEVRLRKAAAP